MAESKTIAQELMDYFPDMFFREAVPAIQDCYVCSRDVQPGLGLNHFARWNEPLTRRAMVEERLYTIAKKYPAIEATIENAGSKSSPYLLLKAGPCILTVSMLERGVVLPREAKFRQQNSRFNVHLFSGEPECAGDLQSDIYAILAHTPHACLSAPDAVRVIFPNSNYTDIHHTRIDLLKEFGGFGYTIMQPTSEEKVEEPKPELKRNNKENRKAE